MGGVKHSDEVVEDAELDLDQCDQDASEDPEISIHALIRSAAPQTMRVQGMIKRQPCRKVMIKGMNEQSSQIINPSKGCKAIQSGASCALLYMFKRWRANKRKFVCGYGQISAPLTSLLKKDSFVWNEAVEATFEVLKRAMTTTPVLALSDFSKPFVIECDASREAIGAVLMQEKWPIAYLSRVLPNRRKGLAIYEKEMISILHAVTKWRPYLLGRRFQIWSDHKSIKYMDEQRVSTPTQHHWLSKLMGNDYEIVYKKGVENQVTDALSRYATNATLHAISMLVQKWVEDIIKEADDSTYISNHNNLILPLIKPNMRSNISSLLRLLILVLLLGFIKPDPEPLQDFCIADTTPQSFFLNGAPCINPTLVRTSHFTTSVLSKAGNTKANPFGFNVTLTNTQNMPGLNTQGLAMGRIDIAANGVVPPHSHPRASEVTICLKGTLLVGFVDTSNRLFTQQLRAGDSFVFPRGLIHFLYNLDSSPALAISGLNSQNPGAQLVALATFASKPSMPDDVLKKAFLINGQDVLRIRKNLGG
ncbi:hypothetical protein HHK36_024856 [Tetracentron sinense]|uniref:Cupin type-1 domain-containing protein n=1 Tax=Tetracentron sinense TaxID=13715 RepID=A0A835D519_TETSI|nr:hypothetical protein HHK36_024856 [Tetracentron sinense]